MADPRFYDNHGPFTLADVCTHAKVELPDGIDGAAQVSDLATLEGAGARHLAFCANRAASAALAQTKAGFCFIDKNAGSIKAPAGTIGLLCNSAQHAFAAALNLFYPENMLTRWSQNAAIDATAKISSSTTLAPGVIIGPNVEIGEGTRIGPNAVIGRGVSIGRDCEIGSNVSISHAYIGDGVAIFPGTQIGQPGFGFASSATGHVKIPQIGRVIVQDKVEIGACCAIDRGAIGDTVIGEGTKIDNLVQVGHNTHIGRHCIIVSQVGISGSCVIGDFVVMGGQAGIADHAIIGDGTRLAARTGVIPGVLPPGRDYGGTPARPVKDWLRESIVLARLAKAKKRDDDG
ncbi:MAG: UDP-3-O-(3-hydroxymyristoyl)glucosamine N-acyltransferase [Proteobacteria bacterium]|nr:UDP-3-O-(3-hydroxymyristoyl)glucosamine N-acyltransferase [Pseudomonadota bacterium]